MATSLKNEREETAVEHALRWKRSATAIGIFFFLLAMAAFWGTRSGYQSLGKVAYVATIVGALSIVAAFLCGIRAIQLHRADREQD